MHVNIPPSKIRFWVYLISLIPSTICSLFILYYLLFDRTLRRALNNHVIIIIIFICLTCQVTIYPWTLYFHNNNNQWDRTLGFCSIWGFIDWGLYITQVILFAWASIERHILIFHDRWVSTRKKRFLVHYSPLILLIIYCFIFYGIVYFFSLCGSLVDEFSALCFVNCLYDNYIFYMWETIVHQMFPNLIIIIFNIALILRVLWQKHRIHRPIQWRKHRRMTIQLFSIIFIYLIFSFPNTFMILMYLCGLPHDVGFHVKKYAEFFSYLVLLYLPFVCIFLLPEIRNKIKKILSLKKRQTRLIAPEILILKNNVINRTTGTLENNIPQ